MTRWVCVACGIVEPVCLYWGLGASPGEPVDYEDLLAVEVFNEHQVLGAEWVMQLRSLHLTAEAAERLLSRLAWLARYVKQPASATQAAR